MERDYRDSRAPRRGYLVKNRVAVFAGLIAAFSLCAAQGSALRKLGSKTKSRPRGSADWSVITEISRFRARYLSSLLRKRHAKTALVRFSLRGYRRFARRSPFRPKQKTSHKDWFLFWSGLRGSNPPPPPWQGGALPNELNPRINHNGDSDGARSRRELRALVAAGSDSPPDCHSVPALFEREPIFLNGDSDGARTHDL